MKEKPILDTDTRLNLEESGDTVIILDLWVDEDGNTQVRINDNFTEKRTVTPEDIYSRIESEGCEVTKSVWGDDEKDYR